MNVNGKYLQWFLPEGVGVVIELSSIQQNELNRPSLVQIKLEESNGFLQSADMGPPRGSSSKGFDDSVVVVIDDNFR
jgi:hypothetical protein